MELALGGHGEADVLGRVWELRLHAQSLPVISDGFRKFAESALQ